MNEQLAFSLFSSLENILKILTEFKSKNDSFASASYRGSSTDRMLTKGVLVFLNVLLIHKISIIYLLHQRNSVINEKFINNLVALLKLSFFGRHNQLRNMLYDFLFSVKSNLTELNKLSPPKAGNGSTTIGNGRINIVLPKLNNDNFNIELTKRLVYYIDNTDELAAQSHDRLYDNLVLYDEKARGYYQLTLKPFDLLEDSSPVINVNDTPVSLRYFDATIEKKNPA